jgi:hypothetical protein
MLKKSCFLLVLLLSAVGGFAQSYARMEPSVIEERLRQYEGLNEERARTMERLFEEAGCVHPFLKEQPLPRFDAPNIICTLPGDSEETIIVGAHFDYIYNGDGVVDNWSGAALLPSLYESLSDGTRRHTFIFIGFSEEEKGMIGSAFYVKRLTKKELSRIRAMVNIDSLGLGPTLVWVSDSDQDLVNELAASAISMGLPLYGMNLDNIGNSDGVSFQRRNIPVITLHSVTPESFRILHTADDTMAAMKLGDYYDSYNLIAGYLASLDYMLGNDNESVIEWAPVESVIEEAAPVGW